MKKCLRSFCSLGVAILGSLCLLLVATPRQAYAESQGNEYKGVTDPFGDPANYEFSEDEKEDKEFFHLGRYVMIGAEFGAGIFTQGLGKSTAPGFLVGGHLLYFFDRAFALEGAGRYSNHLDQVRGTTAGGVDYNENLISINAGFRYYFDIKSAPRAIAIANPYLAFGGGLYMRTESIIAQQGFSGVTDISSTAFGAYGGGGVEFSVYRRHLYLGVDLRYHLVFFPDENDDFSGKLTAGDRAGDYVTTVVTVTYNF